jgi:TrmH family RNA methyltransferase
MLSRNLISKIQKLKQSKFRRETGLFIAEGPKIVAELLASDWQIDAIYGTEEWQKHNNPLLESNPDPFETGSGKELERISFLKNPNQVLAVVAARKDDPLLLDEDAQPALLLDGISDPGNLGTIIRSADWFGFDRIICSNNCVELYNPKVIQATMGSFIRVRLYYTHIPELLARHGHAPVFGTSMSGRSLYETEFPEGSFVIVGNESHGISEDVVPLVDQWVTIPSKSGHTESLNAAIAASLILSEVSRKH